MKLYMTQRSPYARKAYVIALEKNIPLEIVNQNLADKSSELLAANPLGKIPALVLDDGRALVDSPVICEYLDGLKPEPRMIPLDPDQRFSILHAAAIADGVMDASVGAYMEKQRHPETFNQTFVENQEKAVRRALDFFESQLNILSQLNLASVASACALGYLALRLPHLSPEKSHPALQRWFDEFSKRPSMQKTIPVVS